VHVVGADAAHQVGGGPPTSGPVRRHPVADVVFLDRWDQPPDGIADQVQ